MMRCLVTAICLLVVAFISPPTVAAPDSGAVMRGVLLSTAQLIVEREGGGRRTGSSIVLSEDSGKAILLTAAHVLVPLVPQTIEVLTPLRRGGNTAQVLALDSEADLAILEVAGFNAKPVAFAPEGMLGDEVWVAAFPWGGRISIVGGVVSQVIWHDTKATTEMPLSGPVTLIDATVSHGMSGGGVFNRKSGELLGVVRSYRTVKMSLPGEPERTLTFPVGGETTVVPTLRIICFLNRAGYPQLVPDPLRAWVVGDVCNSKS